MIRRSPNQTVPPYKKYPKKINQHPLACSPFVKFLPSNFQEPGILQAPPPFLSHSYPPFSLQRPSAQPPLLPLPAAHPRGSASTRGLSCPPTNRKTGNKNRTRDSPVVLLTPKRPNSSRKENKISPPKPSEYSPLGDHLPKNVAKALPLVSPGNNIIPDDYKIVETNISDKFSGSVVFAISPPPSSLPLPRFSLRPKLCCKVEATGIDTGATNDIRRLLRLRQPFPCADINKNLMGSIHLFK